MTRTSLILVSSFVALGGCNKAPLAPFPTWEPPDAPYVAERKSDNAFDTYVLAAESSIDKAPSEVDRVSFLAGMKSKIVKMLGPETSALARADSLPFRFEYRATDAFASEPRSKGWRLLGRVLVWKIESEIVAKDTEGAAHWALVATRFGLNLTQGDSQTASLGFTVCNEARIAIVPALDAMSASQLSQFSARLAAILAKYPGLQGTVENEKRRMLLGVQFAQDARKTGDYDGLSRRLGRDAKQAVAYLKDLDERKRVAYFESLATATSSFADHWAKQIDEPRTDRSPWIEPDDANTYKGIGRAFWGTIEPLTSIADRSLARTRLLALKTWAMAKAKAMNVAPKSLKGLARSMTMDPFSGNPMVYNASGSEFRVYSVGLNARDDGGDSDDAGDAPDLVLEGPEL